MATRTHTRLEARVYARSATWVANELVHVFIEIIRLRGLEMDHIIEKTEVIMNGLRTWLVTQKLDAAYLEVFDRDTDALVERYDLHMNYSAPGGNTDERFETRKELLESELTRLQALHPGCAYRVAVTLKPDAVAVPGWGPTTLRDTSALRRRDIGRIIDTARINVNLGAWLRD